MSPTVEYVTKDPPLDLGRERWGMTGEGRRFLYGSYHVLYEDGFHVYTPHSAIEGTVSMQPLDVDDPEVQALLLEGADRAHEEQATQ